MKGNPFVRRAAARRGVAMLLVVALLSLAAVAHAVPRGAEPAPDPYSDAYPNMADYPGNEGHVENWHPEPPAEPAPEAAASPAAEPPPADAAAEAAAPQPPDAKPEGQA